MTPRELTTDTVSSLSLPSHLSGYAWRPARKDDVAAIHELMLAVDRADRQDLAGTLEDRYREFDDPWSDPWRDSLLALTPGGAVAAFARVFANPQPEAKSRAFLIGNVHPDHRSRGLGNFILDWMEARGRQRLQAVPGERMRVLRVSCEDNLSDRLELFQGHGFRPVRYFYRMRRDLRAPIPDRPLPADLTLGTYGLEADRFLRQAFNESFSDHWGFETVSPEDWHMFIVGNTAFRPDLTFIALDGDQIAGFSLNRVSPEENERHGIREGWIGQLGVRRPWRRRGVASALLCQSMRVFRAEGLDYATLGVDTENPTGALGLYERLGFVAVRRFVALIKAVE